jgi:uncharacterized protein (TIGR02453 family)
MGFDGFPATAFDWFAGLERDNSRAWFTAHRDVYERDVREPLEDLLTELAGDFGRDVTVFRQHRDVRFSKDKSPYKTRTYGVLRAPTGASGFYAEVSRAGLYAGTGYYQLASDQLERYRAAVLEDGAALAGIVTALEAEDFELSGEALKTAPRGFPRDHEHARLLRHKALFGGRRLAPGRHGIRADAARAHLATTWRSAGPLNAWLDEHVGASTLPPEARSGRPR